MAQQPYPGQGYPGQQAPQGYPPQQQMAPQPAATPPPQPAAPKGGGGGGGLGPPSGPAKMLYFGLILLIVAFSVKQVLVNLSLNSAGNVLEKPKLQAQLGVEIAEIDTALDAIDTEIEDLEADAPKPPEASKSSDDKEGEKADDGKDMEAFLEKSKKHEEKLAKLKKDRAKQDKELEDKRKEVRKKFRPMIREANRAENKAQASGLGRVQLTLLFKLILDFLKIIGAALCVLSGLGIAADPEQSMGLKIYAAVIGGVAFLSVVAGGIASLFG